MKKGSLYTEVTEWCLWWCVVSAALTKASWVSPQDLGNCPHREQSAKLHVCRTAQKESLVVTVMPAFNLVW